MGRNRYNMNNNTPIPQQRMSIIDELCDFINQTKESKEIKRALAVKMILSGKSYQEVKDLLKVSHSFISKWKNQAIFQGVESLRLQYKGSQGYLKSSEKVKIIHARTRVCEIVRSNQSFRERI